ncbi:MAG: RNA-binding domain-containing protein [Candidatus Ranarchaeia archaeon]
MHKKTKHATDKQKLPVIRLNAIHIHAIIHATEDPDKIYMALDTLVPLQQRPVKQFFSLKPPPHAKRLGIRARQITREGHYKNPISLIELRITKTEMLEQILRHWASLLDNANKQLLRIMIKQQLSRIEKTSPVSIYLRFDRYAACQGDLRFIIIDPSSSSYLDVRPKDPGGTFQVRLGFKRPHVSLKKDRDTIHPCYGLIETFFLERSLI